MSKKTKTTALVLMLIILTSKITGFFRDIVLAQTFGAGEITDAYLTALNSYTRKSRICIIRCNICTIYSKNICSRV